jgi:hypothetical protein
MRQSAASSCSGSASFLWFGKMRETAKLSVKSAQPSAGAGMPASSGAAASITSLPDTRAVSGASGS